MSGVSLALPPETVLDGRYQVQRTLSEECSSITYCAWDPLLERVAAVKEFFPAALVRRQSGETAEAAPIREVGCRELFEKQKERFRREAQTVARIKSLRAIAPVLDVFEDNGTVYAVMEYIEGVPLAEHVRGHGPVPAGALLDMAEPLAGDLDALHREGLFHRDVLPHKLLMTPDGSLRLGMPRFFPGAGESVLPVVLAEGFAPLEMYQDQRRHGAWTDIYMFSASLYYALTGRKPPSSLDRLSEETLVPPGQLGAELPKRQEDALLWGLSVMPRARPQDMEIFARRLFTEPLPVPEPPPGRSFWEKLRRRWKR